MKLSVILPARNEEGLIEETISNISSYLGKKEYPFEIIVVINGCIDQTEGIVRDFAKRNSQVKVFKTKPGYGLALRKGLNEAKGDYIALFNVDFYDFHLIDLIEIGLCGKDLIIGSKRTFWSEDKRPFFRRLISAFFNLYLKVTYGFKGSDTHGIKIVKMRVIRTILPKCKITSGIFDTEFVIRTQRANFSIADFPVSVIEKRPTRFKKRLIETPHDLLKLRRFLNRND